MKRPEIHLVIDDLIMDEATAANQSQLERALHRELGRRLTAHRAILPADAAAAASKQIANSISAKSSGGSERGGKGRP